MYGVGLWKGIRKDWYLVSTRISFSVGNGQMVRFCKDKWCGDSSLCVSFLSLFALSNSKEAWVDIWNSSTGGGKEWGEVGWRDGILASLDPLMIGRWGW